MTTGKTIAIVAAVAAGAYILLEVFKPSRGAVSTKPANMPTDVSVISGLLDFGARLFSGGSPSGQNNVGSSGPGSFTPYAPGATAPGPFAPFDPNAGIDPTTGGVVLDEGDTYGPVFS